MTCSSLMRWQQLDPVFVRGMQRSGTSVMAIALQEAGLVGFGEGHLWFELVLPLVRLRDPGYWPTLRHGTYTLGADRPESLMRHVALAIDQFHRHHLGSPRWFDKSPGATGVAVLPLLADLFPRSQAVFMCRNGITVVHSGICFWPQQSDGFERLCRGWTETMSTWRRVRSRLEGRCLEVHQEVLARRPEETARRLAAFLGLPNRQMAMAEVFRCRRVLSSFPDRPPGDYDYRIDWPTEMRRRFVDICGDEMLAWGYEIDFEAPGPPATATAHAAHDGGEP